jgi:hypothetical protein
MDALQMPTMRKRRVANTSLPKRLGRREWKDFDPYYAKDADGNSSYSYLWLAQQDPTLWTHELDLRPAQEKF